MKSSLIKKENQIYRVFKADSKRLLVMDCNNPTMPKWITEEKGFVEISEIELQNTLNIVFEDETKISPKRIKFMNERFTMISALLPFLQDKELRNRALETIAEEHKVSKQTLRRYLCSYLVTMDKRALLPVEKILDETLTKDEKNMRWALNKFYYNSQKNNLRYAYRMMLKEKYTDGEQKLKEDYPSFYQFRYFYRKTKKLQTYYISRDGLKAYQRNSRPLLGEGIQSFAPDIGTGLLDSTICDIYLVDDENRVIGRPVLSACIDAYSGLCCGYSLTLQGGMYNLRNLMLNVVTDKVEHCKSFGIDINTKEWNCDKLLGKFVTDRGSEYKGENFEQLADLGIFIVNLPPYRPDLKSKVEKFFDLVQGYYKPYLKGKGVIEPDFQQRGAIDYRKQACLTLQDFEKVIIHCILFYNSKRVIEDFPYTEELIRAEIKPYASDIWNYAISRGDVNLLNTSKKEIMLTLLPRTTAHFTRKGLRVNGLRYGNEYFMEEYLQGREVTVAYNPDNVNSIFLIDDGAYIEFGLIENRFKEKSIDEVSKLKTMQKKIVKNEEVNRMQAEIDLSNKILIIRDSVSEKGKADMSNIRENRKSEELRIHRDLLREVCVNE